MWRLVALELLLVSGALSWGLGATSSAILVRTTVSTALAASRVGIVQASSTVATSQMPRRNTSGMVALRRILRAILSESRGHDSTPCSSTRRGLLSSQACRLFLARTLTASVGTAWVADTTYLPTRGGFVFLDLFARRVVGWTVADQLDAGLAAVCDRQRQRYRQRLGRRCRRKLLFDLGVRGPSTHAWRSPADAGRSLLEFVDR